jgi:hypothetical protein
MQPQTSNTKKDHNPQDIKLAQALAGSLFGMLKGVHLYPKGHQMLSQVVKKFYSQVKEVLEQKQIAVFRIFENNLFVLDVKLESAKAPGIEDFIEQMQKRYIRQIIFNPSTTLTDIDCLVDLFNIDPDQIFPLGGASLILSQKGAQGIRILEYYARKHSTLDQDRLLTLTNSIIFRFFTDDSLQTLDTEQTHFLYELLQESALICELIKIAAQYILRQSTEMTETQLILKILNKIKNAMTALELSEAEEIKIILKDLISSFNNEELFEMVFENPDAEILTYTEAADHLSATMDPARTAELMVKKISDSGNDASIIAHTKNVLSRLFIDRTAFLNFLPAFKQNLQIHLDKSDKTSSILNDICSAFAPGFSLEDDVELALGTITSEEKNDIADGLEVLKTVHIEKEKLKKHIEEYPGTAGHIEIIQELLRYPHAAELFRILLEKFMKISRGILQGNDHAQALAIFDFFAFALSSKSALENEQKMLISEEMVNISDVLIEKTTLEVLKKYDETKTMHFLVTLNSLFGARFIRLIIRLYAQKGDLPQAHIVKQVILTNHSSEALKLDFDLSKQPTNSVVRTIDLLQQIENDDILPALWMVLFHENVILAQRTIKIIAQRKSHAALSVLLRCLEHPNIALRIVSIEYLDKFRYKEVRSALAAIARGEKGLGPDEKLNNDMRIASLKSLSSLDKAFTIKILDEILAKKKFLFFPIENKELRGFAKNNKKELEAQ